MDSWTRRAIAAGLTVVAVVAFLWAFGLGGFQDENHATMSFNSHTKVATTNYKVTLEGDGAKSGIGSALTKILANDMQGRAVEHDVRLDKLEYKRLMKRDEIDRDLALNLPYWSDDRPIEMPEDCGFGEQWVDDPVSSYCGPRVLVVRKGGTTMRAIARRLGDATRWRELCYYSPRGIVLSFGNYNPWRLKPGRRAGGCA